MRATDQSLCTALILLDFSRAFDTINFEILLSILHYIGLADCTIKLFENYLRNRQQKVSIDNVSSNYLYLRSGVPQGSILGPLLFTVYTSQIVKCLRYCNIHLYADDSQLYKSFKPDSVQIACVELNQDLDSFVNLAKDHCLVINPNKSNVMLFGPRKARLEIKNSVIIKIDNNNIQLVEQSKSLGVIIDSDLRFEAHIATCMKKAYATLKLIYGSRRYLTQKTKIMICESLVLSNLNFADALYGPSLTCMYKSKVQKIQNSCLRLIYGIRRHERISYKLQDSGWLNMERRRLLHAACLYHKIVVNKLPVYLFNKIRFRTDVHTLNIRFKGLLTPPIHRTQLFKRSFSYQICQVYNALPNNLKQVSLYRFKTMYKKLLFFQQCQTM